MQVYRAKQKGESKILFMMGKHVQSIRSKNQLHYEGLYVKKFSECISEILCYETTTTLTNNSQEISFLEIKERDTNCTGKYAPYEGAVGRRGVESF